MAFAATLLLLPLLLPRLPLGVRWLPWFPLNYAHFIPPLCSCANTVCSLFFPVGCEGKTC